MSKKIKRIMLIVFGVLLILIGLAGILYAGIEQMILCYQKFGVIISSEHLIIPDLSLLGYLGIIPLSMGWVIVEIQVSGHIKDDEDLKWK